MSVARTGTGTAVSGAAAITVLAGSGAAAGNYGLILCETANETPGAPSGWFFPGFSASVGSAGVAGGTRATPFYRLGIVAGDISPGVSIGDSGDHQIAAMLTYSGVDLAGTPHIWSSGTSATPATTSVTSGGVATLAASDVKAGDVVLALIATDRDSNTTSTNTSASWANVTGSNSFVLNGSTATGAGGGIIVNELLVTGDATGTVSFTCSITSSIWAMLLVVIKQTPTGRTATLAKTLDAVTVSSAAKLKIAGTLAKTLDTVTLSSNGSFTSRIATLNKTLGTLTLSSNGKLAISGTLAKTLNAVTLSSTSKLAISATLAKILGTLTLSSAAKLAIKGSTAKTLDAVTLTSNAKLAIKGSLNKTLETLTSSGTGRLAIKGSVTKTLGAVTLSSIGGRSGLSGTFSKTLDDVTLSSTAKLKITGISSNTLANVVLTSTANLKISGTLNSTLSSIILSATGIHFASPITANLTTVLESITCNSQGNLTPFLKLRMISHQPFGWRYKRR